MRDADEAHSPVGRNKTAQGESQECRRDKNRAQAAKVRVRVWYGAQAMQDICDE